MYKIEFIFRASPNILYKFLTTPACLVRWFCDKVDIYNDVYTFSWEDSDEKAMLLDDIEEELLRFQWLNAPSPNEYLEFRITESPVTSETILIITDFCYSNELDEMKKLWASQIKQLMVETGG